MAAIAFNEPVYERISAYALVMGGKVLTWADMSTTEARDANLELESDGERMEWLRLEFLH